MRLAWQRYMPRVRERIRKFLHRLLPPDGALAPYGRERGHGGRGPPLARERLACPDF